MRGHTLEVSYIREEKYNQIALDNILRRTKSKHNKAVFARLEKRILIPEAQTFLDIFLPQADEINFIWIPESEPLTGAVKSFRERKHDSTHYSKLFEEAMERGRLVVGYESEEKKRTEDGMIMFSLRDEFTFFRHSLGLSLGQFSIRRRNFGEYWLEPPIPEKEREKRCLLGIYDFLGS